MKQIFYIFILFFANANLYAQTSIWVPNSRHNFETMTVDSGYVRVLYALNAININDTKTYDDLQYLDIGSKLSKSYSFFIFSRDSLVKDFIKKNPKTQSIPIWPVETGKKGQVWSLVIWSDFFKDFSNNTLTEYALMPRAVPNYQYTESMPVQNWKLSDDTIVVAGYLCQKATCRFRGKEFVAWFTSEIPISNGPWKFGGLPGLILKVYDIEKNYVFECTKIEFQDKKFPIIMFDNKKYNKIERTKLRKLDEGIYNDYYKVTGITSQRSDGTPIKFTPIPYYPLELE